MNVAIDIPDEIGQLLAAQAGGASRAVLQAGAVEAYRSGAITTAQVRQMLGLRSRWETAAFLRRAEGWNAILQQFAIPPSNDRRRGPSPICYLILIGEIDLLPKLFSQVLVPEAVLAELLHKDAPPAVRSWASNPRLRILWGSQSWLLPAFSRRPCLRRPAHGAKRPR